MKKEPAGSAYLREELADTQHQLKSLTEENEHLKRQLKMTEEDYRALIGIVERVKQNINLKKNMLNKKTPLTEKGGAFCHQ
ncbi:hypothetical protein BsIDN1_27040 [Bacillus safensis]|uniref:Uncharacterized protein n=1 Tax=Bacillus safensis TaxID=561879 RepID=A0A5S9MC04_BACIA|nr:hypothetical protein BsIDN1_27040 [Bacillus safensis]